MFFGHNIQPGEVFVLLLMLLLPLGVVLAIIGMILRPLHRKLDRALALLEGLEPTSGA